MKNKKILVALEITIILLVIILGIYYLIKFINNKKVFEHYAGTIDQVNLISNNPSNSNKDNLSYEVIKIIDSKKEYEVYMEENDFDIKNNNLDFQKYNYAYIKIIKPKDIKKIKLVDYTDDLECQKIVLQFEAEDDGNYYNEATYIYETPIPKDIDSRAIVIDWEIINNKPEVELNNPDVKVYTSKYNFENITENYLRLGTASNISEYSRLVDEYKLEEKDKTSNFDFNKYSYDFITLFSDDCNMNISFFNYKIVDHRIIYNFMEHKGCQACARNSLVFVIPIEKELLNDLNLENVLVNRSIFNLSCNSDIEKKPILYLYPKQDNTKINVTFAKSNLLTTTYPDFKESWNVTANKNGDLYDSEGNYYYALYWEEKYEKKIDFSEGFYVTKDNAIKFLEEKLSIIGLSDREKNEFIMYWLPILEQNEKSLVYFELTDSKQKYNELIIEPKPDSLLRMTIHIKKVDKEQDIKEQKLEHFERKGFVAVEWGGVKY